MPISIDRWVADTRHLSRADRGLLHDLLVLMWRSNGRVPNDFDWICRKLAVAGGERGNLQAIVDEFCTIRGTDIVNEDLQKQWKHVREISKKAKASANARWDKEKSRCGRNASGKQAQTACNPSTLSPKQKIYPPDLSPLAAHYSTVCTAVGLATTLVVRPSQRKIFDGWVEGWSEYDLEHDILAPIREFLLDHPGPTKSLMRFNDMIYGRKARAFQRVLSSRHQPEVRVARDGEGLPEGELRAALKARIGNDYDRWLAPCSFALGEATVTVTAPSPFVTEHVENHFRTHVRYAAQKTLNISTVEFVVNIAKIQPGAVDYYLQWARWRRTE